MNIEQYTRQATNDGKILVDFLVDNIQGSAPHVTVNHKFKSVEWLAKLGGFIPETAVSPSKNENSAPSRLCDNKSDSKPPITEKQILHFEIARLIKRETQDGKTAIDFLARVVAKGERPKSGENFTVAARMRATRELLIRGFGSSDGGNRRILSGDTEDLGSDLAKRIRGCSNDGAELVHLLVNAMENKNPEAASKGAQTPYPKFERQRKTNPAEGFTASQRVWAACELLRRAYDIKTDHITYEDIQAYWSARTHADARKDDPASPAASLKGFTPEYLETQAAKMRDDADSAAVEQIDAHAKEERDAAAENIDADATEKPADANTPSDTLSRAARRREQRAERKTLKRIPRFPNRRRTREDVAEMLAFKAELESRRVDDLEPPRRKTKKRKAAGERPAAATENIADAEKPDADNTPSANSDRAARRRQKRDARKAEKRNVARQPAAAANIAAAEKPAAAYNTPSATTSRAARRRQKRADCKAQKRNAANTPIANPIPGIHATDINENTVVFSHEPISPEELTRLRQTLAQPDDIPQNARSP